MEWRLGILEEKKNIYIYVIEGCGQLTGGKETVRQFVPVHHVGMSISPDTPPSGAPWYANQSTVANVFPFFFSFLPALVTQTVKLFSLKSSTQATTASWT